MRWLLFGAVASAHIEKEFQALPQLRIPGFDVQWLNDDSPNDTLVEMALQLANTTTPNNSVFPAEILTFKQTEWNISCLIPSRQSSDDVAAPQLLPINNEDILQQARNVLVTELENRTRSNYVDEIWYWSIKFGSEIWQFLPQFVKHEPDFRRSAFAGIIGRPGNLTGQNLATAQPVIVGGKHMLKVEYPGGDICGLTGEPRQAHMFFHCDLDHMSNVTAQTIDEPYPCLYEFLIGVPQLCSIEPYSDRLVNTEIIYCAQNVSADFVKDFNHLTGASVKANSESSLSFEELSKEYFAQTPKWTAVEHEIADRRITEEQRNEESADAIYHGEL